MFRVARAMMARPAVSLMTRRPIPLCFPRPGRSMGSITDEALRGRLEAELKPEVLEVQDVSGGCGDMFQVLVVSKEFEGKPMVKQNRMVYDIVGDDMESIHGLSLQTFTPEKWQKVLEKKGVK